MSQMTGESNRAAAELWRDVLKIFGRAPIGEPSRSDVGARHSPISFELSEPERCERDAVVVRPRSSRRRGAHDSRGGRGAHAQWPRRGGEPDRILEPSDLVSGPALTPLFTSEHRDFHARLYSEIRTAFLSPDLPAFPVQRSALIEATTPEQRGSLNEHQRWRKRGAENHPRRVRPNDADASPAGLDGWRRVRVRTDSERPQPD